jgi:iron complex transport system ATP-binding protein
VKCSKDAGELRVKCRKEAGKEQEKCKRNGEADFMAEDYIWTENMTVGYGKTPLIRQIGIHVRAGEIVTLIGPNGAGKSTILRSVIRQLGLLEGTVYLDGMPMKGMGEREIAKRMSILMTERIHPELMNCEDVVGTGRYPYTGRMGILTAEDRGKVREAMELVHAWDLASRDFSQISDGQKQRILLARAICQDPSVIVLDEPTSFLDIRHKLELLTILKDLVRRKKVAVLMSLHELDLAQKLSDYIVCVKGEYIERCGTPEEIFTSSYITGLYGITKGSYYAEFGCLEMEPVKGKPQVFVIGGNGSGIPVYRRLQRMGIPFAAGILHENDVDYPIARALASQVISEMPFEPIREETYDRAAEVLASCGQVICCLKEFGTLNDKNRKLAELGRDKQGADLLV